jgi:hypothetical protein
MAARLGDVTSVGQPTDAVFSPDGRWIAYQLGEPTTSEGGTWVQPFPPTGIKHQVARTGGRPMWFQRGTDLELFFVPAPGQFKAITIRTQPFGWTNPIDVPRRFALAFPGNPRPYDVLPDGRFVTVGSSGESAEQQPLPIQVVLNWHEELKRLVPTP